MSVIVQFTFDPDADEVDDAEGDGLTEEAYSRLIDQVAVIGGYDIEVTKA